MTSPTTEPEDATGADISVPTYIAESAAIVVEILQIVADLHTRIKALESR